MASFDIYHPDDPNTPDAGFDSGSERNSVFDLAVTDFWLENEPGSITVSDIKADQYGGLEIEMSDGYTLKVFPNASRPREHWRFFEISSDDHFVVLPEPRAA